MDGVSPNNQTQQAATSDNTPAQQQQSVSDKEANTFADKINRDKKSTEGKKEDPSLESLMAERSKKSRNPVEGRLQEQKGEGDQKKEFQRNGSPHNDSLMSDKNLSKKNDLPTAPKAINKNTDLPVDDKVMSKKADLPTDEKVMSKKANLPADEKVMNKKADLLADEKVMSKKADLPADEKVMNKKADLPADEKVMNKKADLLTDEKVMSKKADLLTDEKVMSKKADLPTDEKVMSKKADLPTDEKVMSKKADLPTDEKVLSRKGRGKERDTSLEDISKGRDAVNGEMGVIRGSESQIRADIQIREIPPPTNIKEANAALQKMADQIHVTSRDAVNGAEIRISLKESVMPGTEIRILRNAGELTVTLNTRSAEANNFFASHEASLQKTLAERFTGEKVNVNINMSGGDNPEDGRSRNQYTNEDSDNDKE